MVEIVLGMTYIFRLSKYAKIDFEVLTVVIIMKFNANLSRLGRLYKFTTYS